MADKRATPEASEGAPQAASEGPRRKKRAAPTIDLTATEVPPAQPATPPQPEPPPAAEEPAPANAAQAETRPAQSGGAFGVAALAGGAAGVVAALVVLLGLYVAGLLPMQQATSTTTTQVAADNKAVDALTQRVSKIEETIKKLPAGDAGVAERRADAAAKAVADLRASMQEAAKNSAGISPAELDALQKRIAALEQSTKTARDDIAKASSADFTARLALSASILRDAVTSGAPFEAELAQLKSLSGDDAVLATLMPLAAIGVPTAPALAQELHTLLPVMLKISGAAPPEGGFLERLQANAGKLVRIRPVTAPTGDEPSAVLARLEIDASKADIAAALSDLGKLDNATRAPAQAWIAKAQARQAALDATRKYAADAARALGSKAGAQ